MTQELTEERCIDLRIKVDIPFPTLENPKFEAFYSYFAQCDVSLPTEITLQRVIFVKVNAEKIQM